MLFLLIPSAKHDKIIMFIYLTVCIMKKSSGLREAFNLPIVKRKLISIVIGTAFGFLTAYILWANIRSLQTGYDFWGSILMWNFVFNGFLIWLVVFITWVFTIHPVFKFRFYPELRGAIMWGLVSIDLAFLPFSLELAAAGKVAWVIILTWVCYGIVIDFVASAFWWEGKELLKTLK